MPRVVKLLAVIGLLATPVATPAIAQDYPAKAVKVIVPFAAGGSADVYGRIIAHELQEALKQSFVIENRAGAGAVIGTDAVAKAAPDGHTLLVMSNTHTTNESLIPNKPYQLLRDLAPVAFINSSDLVMVVHPSVPAKTLAEFIALAKSKPNGMNYASSGPGTPYHMAGELFKAMSGTDIVHVPYSGSSGARNDIVGGHVQMMFDAITTMMEQIKGGQLRALATSGPKRSAVLPEIPTVAEAGVPGYDATIWLGVMAPTGTPKPIIDKLNAEIARILARADIKENWARQGADTMAMSPAEFDAFLRKDIEKWAKVVQLAGLKAP